MKLLEASVSCDRRGMFLAPYVPAAESLSRMTDLFVTVAHQLGHPDI